MFAYITEGSFDGYSWQLVEAKARFIEQAMAGEITARTIEDTSDVVLSAAEIKAIASGNPQIVRKVQLEAEVARLERLLRARPVSSSVTRGTVSCRCDWCQQPSGIGAKRTRSLASPGAILAAPHCIFLWLHLGGRSTR